MENVSEMGTNFETKPVIPLLRERAEGIKTSTTEISPESKQTMRENVGRFSQTIPEATLIGGVALRVWLDKKGLFVPQEFGKDIDFTLNREKFNELNGTFVSSSSQNSITEKYRKKGNNEKTPFGEQNFNKDRNNYIALEDKKSYAHIDIFVNQNENVQTIDYQDNKLSIISPEELFLGYAKKAKNELEKSQLQRRTVVYFYLSSLIVDEKKIDPKLQWENAVRDLDAKIQKAGKEGKVVEEVTHL